MRGSPSNKRSRHHTGLKRHHRPRTRPPLSQIAVLGDSLALPGRGLCSSFCTVSRSSVLTACSSSWSFPIFPLRAALLPQHHPALSGASAQPSTGGRWIGGGGCACTSTVGLPPHDQHQHHPPSRRGVEAPLKLRGGPETMEVQGGTDWKGCSSPHLLLLLPPAPLLTG